MNGWKTGRLAEACSIEKMQGKHNGLPYVGMENIESNTGRFPGSKDVALAQSATFRFSQEHILYGRLRPYLNKLMMPDFIGHCSTELLPIKPREHIARKFLFYWLAMDSTVSKINATCTGARMPRANMNEVLELEFSSPSLSEQNRIAAILDEVFEGIAGAVANAEKNIASTRELFSSYLGIVFAKNDKGWAEGKLGNVAEIHSGGTPLVSRKEFWGGDIPWYSSGELNETYTTEPERRITEDGLNGSNAKIFPAGSLLIGMYDTAALKMSILDRDGAFNQAIAGMKPNGKIDIEFVLHAINHKKQELLLERRGVRQKNLSLGKIRDIEIPLPNLSEQRAAVRDIRSLATETQQLGSLYQRKLDALARLKQSTLEKAFLGGLTAQPERALQEAVA